LVRRSRAHVRLIVWCKSSERQSEPDIGAPGRAIRVGHAGSRLGAAVAPYWMRRAGVCAVSGPSS